MNIKLIFHYYFLTQISRLILNSQKYNYEHIEYFKGDIQVKKKDFVSITRTSIFSSVGLIIYYSYHWIGCFIGYSMTYSKIIMEKEQNHRVHLSATLAKWPSSPVVSLM